MTCVSLPVLSAGQPFQLIVKVRPSVRERSFAGISREWGPGKPEPLPWADALQKDRAANNSKDATGARCLPRGLTNAGALFPYKLVQTPTLLVMLFESPEV